MNSVEQSETDLEKLIESLKNDVEERVKSFTAKDIAMFSGSMPRQKTMLDYRGERENFLKKIENMQLKLQPHFYFEDQINRIMKKVDISIETSSNLTLFFTNEVKRIEDLRERVTVALKRTGLFTKCEPEYAFYMKTVSQNLDQCERALERLDSGTTASYSLDDVLVVIRARYLTRTRNLFLKHLAKEVRRMSITHRRKIIESCFLKIEEDLAESKQKSIPVVPFLPNMRYELDEEIQRLAKRFGVTADFKEEDGQLYLHHCGQLFGAIWTKLINIETWKEKRHDVGPRILKSQAVLVDEALFEETTIDQRVRNAMSIIEDDDERKVNAVIKDFVYGYNQVVGNKITGALTTGMLKKNEMLPGDRLTCWEKLRIMNSKFLLHAILSHYNFFEAVKQNLHGGKYVWKPSKEFPDLISVFKNDKEIIFETATSQLSSLKQTMMAVVSHYSVGYELAVADGMRRRVVDREKMIEEFLTYELMYSNAKRKLIQPLFEAHIHSQKGDIVKKIYEIICERPMFRLPMYNSFDYPFKMAINVMEKKASIIQTLYQLQIITERRTATLLSDLVPIYDRAVTLTDITCPNLFSESIPLSPFENYPFLAFIAVFLDVMDDVALEIAEGIDLKSLQFLDYMNLSVVNMVSEQIANFNAKGYVPFDIGCYPFKCELSESVFSLIRSPYLNDLNAIYKIIDSVAPARRLRFAYSFIRFLEIGWKLQSLVIDCDRLQQVYADQASGASVVDPRVLVQPFTEVMKKDLIDHHDQLTTNKVLEFALVDFENPEFNFSDDVTVKDYLMNYKFEKLLRILQFQKQHRYILEVATRYNNVYIDNAFLVSHFGMNSNQNGLEEEDVDLFLLTQADDTRQAEATEELTSDNFIRSFLANTILTDSQYIMDNYKKAGQNFEHFFLNIKQVKVATRMILNAHVKQKEYTNQELYEFYLSEIMDAFSASAYRLEVVSVCKIQRQLLLTNTFTDVFILEPTKLVLANEAGRIANHFIVPSWADAFLLVRTAPLARQVVVFKGILIHVTALLQIVSIVRFETALSQNRDKAFRTLWNSEFHLETPLLQKLLNELVRLPGGNEFDVSAQYLNDKLFFFYQRIQLALMHAYEVAMLSVSEADNQLADAMMLLHNRIKTPQKYQHRTLTSKRFVPEWTSDLLGEYDQVTRGELARQLGSVDLRIDDMLDMNRIHAVLEPGQAIVIQLDFLKLALLHFRLKCCLFLIINGTKFYDIDDPFTAFKKNAYVIGMTQWNENYVPEAAKSLAPKDTSAIIISEVKIPEEKVLQAQIDVVRNHIDMAALSMQLDDVAKTVEKAREEFVHPLIQISKEKPSLDDRVLLEQPEAVDRLFRSEMNTVRWFIVDTLMKGLSEITAGNIINTSYLENLAVRMSEVISLFSENSVDAHVYAWRNILAPYIHRQRTIQEWHDMVTLFSSMSHSRYEAQLRSEISHRLNDAILDINKYEDLIYERKHSVDNEDIVYEERTRYEFQKLIADLETETANVKEGFKQKRKSVYDIVLGRIEKAKDVHFENKAVRVALERTGSKHDYTEMNAIRKDIDQMRSEILKLRLARILSSIASRRFYTKRIQAYEQDRVQDRGRLWESRRDFDVQEQQMQQSLQESYRKLGDTEIEIEKLRQQLDNEKQSTIQLVHWKAKNVKREKQLEEEVKKVESAGDVNVAALLQKLETARTKLEELRNETNEIDAAIERSVRTPMRRADRVRKQIQTAKIQRGENIKSRSMARPQTSLAQQNLLIDQYRDENLQLRSRNESLSQQIEALVEARSQMGTSTAAYMQEIVPIQQTRTAVKKSPVPVARQRPSSTATTRTITRPKTSFTPRRPSNQLDTTFRRRV